MNLAASAAASGSSAEIVTSFSPFGALHHDTGLGYIAEGRNKRHITLNLENPKGREIFKSLVGGADVLIETYPAGTMDAWGLGYEELAKLNPRLILCSITGYGQFGPDSGRRQYDYDNVAQARSGIQYMLTIPGSIPPTSRPGIIDRVSSMQIFGGIAATAVSSTS
mgnify:CR=1 FL=1